MTSLSLQRFGWDGLVIPSNLANLCKHLPKWHQLKTLRSPQVCGRHTIYFPHRYFLDVSGAPYMPAIEKGALHNDNGGYSEIYLAQRAIYKPVGDLSGTVHMVRAHPFEEICIKEVGLHVTQSAGEKEFMEEINAILYEAYLHALIDETLERNNLHGCVPRLHEVLAISSTDEPLTSPRQVESIWMTMEFMNGETLERFLSKQFASGSIVENTRYLKNILLQLAHILQILQSTLLFNHRDLKINNLYVRHHPVGWKKTLTLPQGPLECLLEIVMIDFGFSCISCGSGFPNPRATLLGAGSYFPPDDDCLKKGRDLAQFLYSLHCTFPLQNYISKSLFEVLHRAMMAERRGTFGVRSCDLFMGLDAIGTPLVSARLPTSIKYNNGIYLFLRDPANEVPGCEPSRLLQALWDCC